MVTMKKSPTFLHISNKHLESEIFLKAPLLHNKIKNLGISLIKNEQEFYLKYFKTLQRANKDIIEIYLSCTSIGRHNIVKMSTLPNLIYKFNTIQIKIPTGIL